MAGLRSRLSYARDAARAQLWPTPAFGIVLSLVLGVELPTLDRAYDGSLSPRLSGYLFSGDADAARSVLSAVSGSLITVTSLTFSLTVVTLQLASGQFSPRLLRSFVSDRLVHLTLALFLGTFTYSLAVLRTVHAESASVSAFIPRLSVTVAFLLAVTSIVGLVLFLAHLARQIRVETMLRNTHEQASATARRVLPAPAAAAADKNVTSVGPPLLVRADRSGFLVRTDEGALLRVALDHDLVVRVDVKPGSSLVREVPVASVWARDGRPLTAEVGQDVQKRVSGALTTGFERTSAEDVELGLRQLTDVCIKALSPGINDPTTAVHALGHASALLCEYSARDLSDRVCRDDAHHVRVVLARPSLADLLDLALVQPCHYGAADMLVMRRILQLLRELSWCVSRHHPARERHRVVVRAQLERVWAVASDQDYDPAARAGLQELAELARLALEGAWQV